MIADHLLVKRFIGLKFGYGEPIPDGFIAVPCATSRGNAFIKMEFENGITSGKDNFKLFWDESLTISWHDKRKPFFLKESKFSKLFRQIESIRQTNPARVG